MQISKLNEISFMQKDNQCGIVSSFFSFLFCILKLQLIFNGSGVKTEKWAR